MDSAQSESERHGYENLMLMCVAHHRVIDNNNNLGTYTIKVLTEMKSAHELAPGEIYEPPEEVIKEVLKSQTTISVSDNSVTSINQMGGQTAHSIVNVGTQPRRLFRESAKALCETLRPFSAQEVRVVAVHGDSEATGFANEIAEAFRQAGWEPGNVAARKYHIPSEWVRDPGLNRTRGITVQGSTSTPELQAVSDWVISRALRILASYVSDISYYSSVCHNQGGFTPRECTVIFGQCK